ncbi:alpha-2A adrenergic receptor-like [Mytilus edulis]|uniref:alpha-2A adrenergic receptor-like n=1 Tax=Mytilus edulis TaxID=6550 RepID=UPI0039EDF12B
MNYSITQIRTITTMPNNSNYSENYSIVAETDLLRRLNDEKVVVLLPVIILVFLMMLIGIIGNTIVCIVYIFKIKRAPSHYFILYLAILDLVSCSIGMPSELADLFQPFVFPSAAACKFLRFVLSFTIISSCIILICVAFDRYYKVCKPLKSFPMAKVQKLCLFSFFIGAVFSWPALVIYGLREALTSVPNLYGHECSTSDTMKGKPWPLIYYGTLIGAFTITFAIFVTLYVQIGREINRRRTMFVGSRINNDRIKSLVSEEESTTFSDDDSKFHKNKVRKSSSFSQLKEHIVYYFRAESEPGKEDGSNNVSSNGGTVKRRRKSSRRYLKTTYIFLAVFIAFLVSFVPYLVVNILRFSKVAFVDMNSGPDEIIYNLCVRSYFISNFINPIIYSLMNNTFRKESKKLLRKCRLN